MRMMFQVILAYAKKFVMLNDRLFIALKYVRDLVFGYVQPIQAYVIKGSVKETGHMMNMLFVGSENSAHQLASLVYSQVNEFFPARRFSFRQINPSYAPKSFEIIAVRLGRPFASKFQKQDYLLLPNVNFILNLEASLDNIIKRMSRRRRRDSKKIKTLNYSYTISRNNIEDLNFFYQRVYLPYARKRFEKSAYIKSYLESKVDYRVNGGIIFVKKDGKRVAGILFQVRGKTLYALSFGVYEGDQKYIKDSAGQATLFCLIKWAKRKGMKSLNYGTSMPFLADGIFIYKKEWGMFVEEQIGQPFCALRINLLDEGSLSFIQQNPFIVLDKKAMKGVVFVDHMLTKAELQQIFSKYFIPKLRSLIVVSYYSDTETKDKIEFPESVKTSATHLMKPLSNICLLLQERGFKVDVFKL